MAIDSSPTIPGFLNVYFGLPAIVKGDERFHSDNFALVIPEVVHVEGVTVDIRASLHANPYTGVKLLEEFFPRVFGADPALSAQRLPAYFIVIDDRQDPGGPQETPYTQPYNPEQLTDQKIEEFLRTSLGQGRPLW